MSMPKKYADLLSFHIKRSGLTLREIAQQCRERGCPIDPSYISKLQTGRLPPPSEGISQILAQVLEASVEELTYWGYVEKAPKVIRQRLSLDPDLSPEVVSCAKRIYRLSTLCKQIIMDEIRRLEDMENSSHKAQANGSL